MRGRLFSQKKRRKTLQRRPDFVAGDPGNLAVPENADINQRLMDGAAMAAYFLH
jgi:hypothetical protein